MAMEPLPLGFGDAMDTTLFSTLWSFQEELQPQEVRQLPPPQPSTPPRNSFPFFYFRSASVVPSSGRQEPPRRRIS